MRQFVCPECHATVRPTALFFSGERTYWCAQYARYDAACHHEDNGLANGIHGCPFMRQAIDAWLIPGLDAGSAGSPEANHDDMVPRPVATSDPTGRMGPPMRVAPMPVAPMPVAPMPVAPMPVAPMPVAPMPVAPMPVAPMPVAPMPVATSDDSHQPPSPENEPESALAANLDGPFAALMNPAAPPRDTMMRFQSLGDNCEFGLLQRWAEAEPLDLLRFAGFFIPVEHRLRRMIEALAVGFFGLGEDPSSVHCELQGDVRPRPYMVRETRWNLSYHIDEDEETIDPGAVHHQQVIALRFRRRKLLEDLREAHRVFVWKSNVPTREAEIRELVACLKNYGPNLLLWVEVAEGERRVGSVEYAGRGLVKGYVRRFAPYHDATDIDSAAWYDMCQKAWTISEILRRQGEWGHATPR